MPGHSQEKSSANNANANGNAPAANLPQPPSGPITVPMLRQMKQNGIPITSLTCYDFAMASQLERAGIDVILVGDSLGNVIQGQTSTLPVQLEDMIYHTKAVGRAVKRALLIADLPFVCMYSVERVVEASVRLLAEAGAQMVKLEMSPGTNLHAEMISALVARSIPVCAHIGLTPQSVHSLGGYRVQGKDKAGRTADQLMEQAVAAEQAGATLLVLECVPDKVSQKITERLGIPTLSIGGGLHCDGQLLVLPDMLGMNTHGKMAKFVKNFLIGQDSIQAAVEAYVQAVRRREFPADEHMYH